MPDDVAQALVNKMFVEGGWTDDVAVGDSYQFTLPAGVTTEQLSELTIADLDDAAGKWQPWLASDEGVFNLSDLTTESVRFSVDEQGALIGDLGISFDPAENIKYLDSLSDSELSSHLDSLSSDRLIEYLNSATSQRPDSFEAILNHWAEAVYDQPNRADLLEVMREVGEEVDGLKQVSLVDRDLSSLFDKTITIDSSQVKFLDYLGFNNFEADSLQAYYNDLSDLAKDELLVHIEERFEPISEKIN